MTKQVMVSNQSGADVVYQITDHNGYWSSQTYDSLPALIVGALARGWTVIGRNALGLPLFGPGERVTLQGTPDPLYGPEISIGSGGKTIVRYANTGAAYLWGWKGLPADFYTSDF